jgi:hypothetical protein
LSSLSLAACNSSTWRCNASKSCTNVYRLAHYTATSPLYPNTTRAQPHVWNSPIPQNCSPTSSTWHKSCVIEISNAQLLMCTLLYCSKRTMQTDDCNQMCTKSVQSYAHSGKCNYSTSLIFHMSIAPD